MTNGHVGFTCVVCVVKINFLATILEGKAVKPFYTVGGHFSLRCHILLWSFSHFLKEIQKGISLFMTLQRFDGVVRTPIFSFLRIMSEMVRFYIKLSTYAKFWSMYYLLIILYLAMVFTPFRAVLI